MRIGLLVIVLLMLIGMACNRGDDETPIPKIGELALKYVIEKKRGKGRS